MSTNTFGLYTTAPTDRRTSKPPTRYDPASGKAVVVDTPKAGNAGNAGNAGKPNKPSAQELAAQKRAAQAAQAAKEQEAWNTRNVEFNTYYFEQLLEQYGRREN
jgi:hypothetical protein